VNNCLPPSHVSRTADEIVNDKLVFDSAGYLYRAMSWLDYFEKQSQFTSLMYACIEARVGIEYLIFEEIVISTGAKLSQAEYEKCLKDSTKLYKILNKITPDYLKLQEFSLIIISFEPRFPKVIQWNMKELLKSWGVISSYLHWSGSRNNTTELKSWRDNTFSSIKNEIEPIWLKITSGKSAMMHPDDMHPEIKGIWCDFENGKVDREGVKIRMNILNSLFSG